MNSLTITLPEVPPSVNALYFNLKRGGRAKTKKYAEWIKLCQYVIKPPPKPITCPVRVSYCITRPSKRKMDVENRIKGISDLLVKSGVLADDSQIVDLRIHWATEPQISPVEITITKLEE